MTDEELIEQVARDIEAVKCGLNYDYMDFCRDAAHPLVEKPYRPTANGEAGEHLK